MKSYARNLFLCLLLVLFAAGSAWPVCGDVNGDGTAANLIDVTYTVNFIYEGGPPPPVPADADMDGCTGFSVLDLIILIERIFYAGPLPTCTGPGICTPGGDAGLTDEVKLVLATPPVPGTNVPVVVELYVFVDANNLKFMQMAWSWDNPDFQILSATPTSEFNVLGPRLFLDNDISVTNVNQMAIASGAVGGAFPADVSGWRLIATYNMEAALWTATSSVTFDIDSDPAYPSTELIFGTYGGIPILFYYPNWAGAVTYGDADADGIENNTDNCPDIANPGQENWDNDAYGDACNPTPAGTNVAVQISQDVTITFTEVTTAGITGIIPETSGPFPPANLGIVPLNSPIYFQIFTSASFVPPIEICFDYDPVDVYGPEADMKLMHYDGSNWNDIKSSQDLVNHIICGMTNSLSYFALMEVCCIGNRGDCNSDGTDANILDLTFAVDRIFRGGPPSLCATEADVNADGIPHNILDLTFLVDYIFRGGPLPGTCP